MNIFIMLAIVATNAIAIALIYQFVKRLSKMDKLVFIAGSVAMIYVIVSIVYWISGFGIDQKVHEAAKSFITYTFVPVNVILLVPFVATKYNKLKNNEIGRDDFFKRLAIVGIVAVIILIVEYNYFKGMQLNMIQTIESRNNVNSANEIVNEHIVNETTINKETANEQVTTNSVSSVNEQVKTNSTSFANEQIRTNSINSANEQVAVNTTTANRVQ